MIFLIWLFSIQKCYKDTETGDLGQTKDLSESFFAVSKMMKNCFCGYEVKDHFPNFV